MVLIVLGLALLAAAASQAEEYDDSQCGASQAPEHPAARGGHGHDVLFGKRLIRHGATSGVSGVGSSITGEATGRIRSSAVSGWS